MFTLPAASWTTPGGRQQVQFCHVLPQHQDPDLAYGYIGGISILAPGKLFEEGARAKVKRAPEIGEWFVLVPIS